LDRDIHGCRPANNSFNRGIPTIGRAPELIRARHINACAEAKRFLGRNSEAMLARAGLPTGCKEDDTALFPLAYFERFLSASCTPAEVGAFSYRAAPSDLNSYRGIVAQAADSSTLREALEDGTVGTAEISNQSFHHGSWRQKTWIYTVPSNRDPARLAWSPYLLKPLLALVRSVAGESWWPNNVLLPCSPSRDLEAIDAFRHANVEFDMSTVAIEVTDELLDRVWVSSLAERHTTDEDGEIPNDLLPALRALLKSYSHDRPLQLATIAELTGCSVRSLQRDLRRAEASYTALTQEARYLAAVRLLSTTDSTVTDVAYELGYSDPAHFTRAFQRNSGASPRTFRELGHAMV